jgi:hypothetical protein
MPIAIAHDSHVEEPVTISTVREVRQRQRCQGDGEPDRDGVPACRRIALVTRTV